MKTPLFSLITSLIATVSLSAADVPTSLKQAVNGRYEIGVGLSLRSLLTPENQPLLFRHFNYVTPENCMKFASTQPAEGQFNLDQPDRFVAFANENDLKVLGHCLIWAKDDRTPEWFYRDGDEQVSAEKLMLRMKTHIRTIVERYQGRVHSWDVVNEALVDGSDGYLRDSVWANLLSDDFIVEAFRYTHELDPDATLIYNDYHIYQPNKRVKLERLIKKLQDAGAPIHAIGIQGHFIIDEIPYQQVEELLILLRKLNLKIVVSELDIDMVPRGIWWANGGRDREEIAKTDPLKDGCPPELLQRQAEQYGKLFDLFGRYEDVIQRISFWNLHDGESWLNYFPWNRTNYPVLFDRERQPKPAYDAVIKSLTK